MTDATEEFLQPTRTSYDVIAKDYAAQFPPGDRHPLDRGVITAFAELVTAHGTAPVADVGSGPGDVTALVHDLGVPVFGVDLSPAMATLARETYPHLRFHIGSMTSLGLPDAALGGILALYSTIHIPDSHLPRVFAEFHRCLLPGGHVLLAFQTATEPGHLHLPERYGHAIDLDYYWRTTEQITGVLAGAGLRPAATVRREPSGDEKLARVFVLARKA